MIMIDASNAVLELQIHMEYSGSGVTVFHQYMMKNKKIIKDFIKRLVVMMLPPMIFMVILLLVMILLFLMLLLSKLLVMMLMVRIKGRTFFIMIAAISVVKIIDSYGSFKRWCYCIPSVYDEELDDLSSEAYTIQNMVTLVSMLDSCYAV